MKKILVVISAVVVSLVIFGAGFVFAQTQNVFAATGSNGMGRMLMGSGGDRMGHGGPGRGGMMGGKGNGGYGTVHNYAEEALAAKLDMTLEDLEKEEAAGKNLYQIALDHGITEANVDALLTEVHKTALEKAVAEGVLTQAQADTMLQNMQGNWKTMGGFGRGGMMMGGRGNSAIHTYVEEALAAKLGITVDALEAEKAAGKTPYQIALAHGIAEADIATVFSEVHKTALTKAVAEGVLTQEQADAMLQHMQDHWQDGNFGRMGDGMGRHHGRGFNTTTQATATPAP